MPFIAGIVQIGFEGELPELRVYLPIADALGSFFCHQPVVNQVGDGANFKLMFFGEQDARPYG